MKRNLKLSVLDLAPVFGDADAHYALQQALRLARRAEELGYHRYWVAEHHDMLGLACTSPEVLLAHIGAQTSQIRLGSGALLLPHYKPLKVAESFHLLASLYPGRIDLGIGRAPGGSAHATIALSGNFLESLRHLPDALKALMELLAGEYRQDGEPVVARPVPPQPLAVWMLGTNQKSASYAAEFGTGYVFGQFMSDNDGAEMLSAYRQQFRPSRLMPEPQAIVAVSIVCAESEAEAKRLASQTAGWFQPEADKPGGTTANAALAGVGSPDAASKAQAELEPPTPSRRMLVGTPDQIRRKLEQLRELYGVDEFLLVSPVPDYEKRLRGYEWVAGACL
ncbi:LLM class flavin-dependent oxidoreductase [Paenibacillus agricola]|uniref:LLM class flavin-dependent oxidoreductase n=1 Tax=Paenibacillus agricola TaxID=2716264 RepID=A0ABX0J4U7_9BACL|nr:LLM class flavin-dependent oxidoreductase [Paenibacillus agricola]NHN31340.1 LLM class flavin-dependent oxidoreductase [Paenibacillus agricola]